jgi:1-acyl-sn-glycerol-3-phosphate acyltransferase
MTCLQFFYFITRGKIDKQRKMPIFVSQCWGEALLTLTRMWPKIRNQDVLQRFYQQKRPAMIVANHNSWMDIPFLGGTIGWRNYKLVSKKELGKVPILGKSIKVGGHIMVDRTDRKSQLKTLKSGINLLKVSV